MPFDAIILQIWSIVTGVKKNIVLQNLFQSKSFIYKNQHIYFPDGKLRLMFAIKFFVRPVLYTGELRENNSLGPPPQQKRKIVQNLFDSLIVSKFDIKLVFSDGSVLKANTKMLAIKSTVFASLLTPERLREMNGTLMIKDFSRKVMIELLRFIYCGEINKIKDEKVQVELFKAASFYKIEKLPNICAKSIKESSLYDKTHKTVLFYAKLAIEYECDQLLTECCKIIHLWLFINLQFCFFFIKMFDFAIITLSLITFAGSITTSKTRETGSEWNQNAK